MTTTQATRFICPLQILLLDIHVMSSTPTTPAGPNIASSHPLSPELQLSTGRRARTQIHNEDGSTRPNANYFTLKAQAEQANRGTVLSEWSASKRDGWNTLDGEMRRGATSRSVAYDDRSKSKPVVIVSQVQGSASTMMGSSRSPYVGRSISVAEGEVFGTVTATQVLETKWHELSDQQIEASLARHTHGTASSVSNSTVSYQPTLRVLSSALEDSIAECEALRELLVSMRTKEKDRFETVERLISRMPLTDQPIARRVLEILSPIDSDPTFEQSLTVTKRPSIRLVHILRRHVHSLTIRHLSRFLSLSTRL